MRRRTVGPPSSAPTVFDFRKSGREVAPFASWQLRCPVFFVGFMAAGKTTVVRRLARMTSTASVDLDAYLERRSGRRIPDIFAEQGEAAFRDLETAALRDRASGGPLLVSCGGGIVVREENRRILNDAGYVVFLQVTAYEAASRIRDVSTRPLFGDLENAQRVNRERQKLYRLVADAAIDTAGKDAPRVAREAFRLLKKEGILWR